MTRATRSGQLRATRFSCANPYLIVAVARVAVALATLLLVASRVGRREPLAVLRVD